MSSRQPSYFLLLRQKKVTKEKATPLRVSLIREKLRSSARAEGIGTGHCFARPPTASLREAWNRGVRVRSHVSTSMDMSMYMRVCASASVSEDQGLTPSCKPQKDAPAAR
ncbi:hypothetical protein H4CHR_00294 [Variovorax sp. PBS-H4]|nr:hypothetical protein H4CHR_00294 [Variovorax sp. PBS-H4]